jgi:hypothetical protein
MYILKHNNVDGYNTTRDNWPERPTKDELRDSLSAFHSGEQLDNAVEDLHDNDEASLDDYSSTTYELEHI